MKHNYFLKAWDTPHRPTGPLKYGLWNRSTLEKGGTDR